MNQSYHQTQTSLEKDKYGFSKQKLFARFSKVSQKFLEQHRAPASFSYDQSGLIWLSKEIEKEIFGNEPSIVSEDAFLEGAGATLALILGNQFKPFHLFSEKQRGSFSEKQRGSASNGRTHGMSLGLFGIFFPFEAINATLQAENPNEELLRQIEIAEAEATGIGPYSKTFQRFIEKTQQTFPDLEISNVCGFEITFRQGFSVDLKQVCQSTLHTPISSVDLAITNLLQLIPHASNKEKRTLPWEQIQHRIFPRVVSNEFITSLQNQNTTDSLFRVPFLKQTYICLVIQHQKRNKFVRLSEIQQWNKEKNEILQKSILNLQQASQNLTWSSEKTAYGNILYSQNRDGLDSARILLPNLKNILIQKISEPVILAIPHRDLLMIATSSNSHLEKRFSAQLNDAYQKAPHSISNQWFTFDEIQLP